MNQFPSSTALDDITPLHPAAEERASTPGFTLYHLPYCGYCRKVRRAADELGIPLQLIDIRSDRSARELLLMARGQTTVPVLRIPTADGFELLPESDDIVAFLRDRARERQRAAA